MLKSLIVLGCFLSLQAYANPADQTQAFEITGESILHEGLPFIAVRTKESGLTYGSESFAPESHDYALSKAQKRADQICHNMNYLHASPVKMKDLAVVKSVEGWLLNGPDSIELATEERKVSQLSWISMFGGTIAYREPLVFKSLVCIK